jgi:hypothetical protein
MVGMTLSVADGESKSILPWIWRTVKWGADVLNIIVLIGSPHRKAADPHWRERCAEVFCELRSHLAATVVSE